MQDATARGGAHLVGARPVQTERQTVEEDHSHAEPLEPRSNDARQGLTRVALIVRR